MPPSAFLPEQGADHHAQQGPPDDDADRPREQARQVGNDAGDEDVLDVAGAHDDEHPDDDAEQPDHDRAWFVATPNPPGRDQRGHGDRDDGGPADGSMNGEVTNDEGDRAEGGIDGRASAAQEVG
ncbi:hypothetical protein Rhe02_53680 [Rhizocola hellebori]|uniref:Uncharacterized protein n=1 Tax=Rhizocola hellebori TaxID=1392758 RepID=A0A8J3VIQ3_9ACTN|nr:hypothetical protein Rhe02_53680 [Rhizocola hellebori]